MKDIQHRPEKYILKHDLEQTLGELLMQAHQLRDNGAEFEALRVEGIIYKIAEKFDMKQFL